MTKRVEIDGFAKDTISSGAVSGFATGVLSISEGMADASLVGAVGLVTVVVLKIGKRIRAAVCPS